MNRKPESNKKLNRRQFLKISGLASGVLGSAGIGLFGYASGKDPMTYSGWQTFEGANQTFDRTKWETDNPTYEKVGQTERVDARTGVIFDRRQRLMRQWNEQKGIDGLSKLLKNYYNEHPKDLELDLLSFKEIFPKYRKDAQKYRHQFKLINAWSDAIGAVTPPPVNEPPEISDFPKSTPYRKASKPLKLKSPEKTSKLIKKISFELGSTLVGITELNPDWVYSYPHRNRGFDPEKPLEVPQHWKYAIVVGSPMSWDPMYANPNYGTSNDAYSRSRIVAYRVAAFIKNLGYAARPHTPGNSYDLMVPPICIDAGLGEQGRHGVLVTPELGSNFRPAVITTNLPVKPDKPIDIGIQDFCKSCKICAENCPSNSITYGDKVEIRGYKKYKIDIAKCLNFWYSNLGGMGCRLCVAVCPYTRKANWLHKTAFKSSLYDPTGIIDPILTSLQKRFYPSPDPEKYYIPSLGGENASYREPPWWLKTEDFFEF